MQCFFCTSTCEKASTTFTVAKGERVYVVRDVPALECPTCGHVSYSQKVARFLEALLTSGRIVPRLPNQAAWVYSYADCFGEAKTENISLVPPVSSAT